MAQDERGWRGFADDVERLKYLLAAIATTVGLSWAAWTAFRSDLGLAGRILVALSIGGLVTALWVGLLFLSHYYFGRPAQNPFTGSKPAAETEESTGTSLRFYERFDEHGIYLIEITNDGPTDSFGVQTYGMAFVEENPGFPLSFRWRGTDSELREILKGHTQTLELIRIEHTRNAVNPPESRFEITNVYALTPSREIPLHVRWVGFKGHVMEKLMFNLRISSRANGLLDEYEVFILAATDGRSEPQIAGILRPKTA